MKRFQGTGVAVVTPFDQGKVDFDALGLVLDHVINGGVDYIVSLGSTGEAITLSPKEQRAILDFTIAKIDGRLLLMAGNFGGSNTAAICQRIADYDFAGIDAILSSSPAYNKPSQEGIYLHYRALAEASPVPVMMYNVPGRTASNMEASTTLRIAEHCPNILGIKEASADLEQAVEIIEGRPEGFLIVSGDDPTALSLILAGGDGVISVIANAYPEHFSEMTRAALNGAEEKAKTYDNALAHLHHHLYVEGNPSGIKATMHALRLCRDEVRLPLTPMTDKGQSDLRDAMKMVSNP